MKTVPVVGIMVVITAAVLAYSKPRGYTGPSDVPAFTQATNIETCTGGDIARTLALLDAAQAQGHKMRADGLIESACTLIVSYQNVCWTPTTDFRFHGAHNETTGANSLVGTLMMWSHYPSALRAELPPPAVETPTHWTDISGRKMADLLGHQHLCH